MSISLQIQARALGDPTRHGIFRCIADSSEPVDVAELTAQFGLNHNAIRQHLAKLVDAELVVESVAPVSGPGRPRLLYELNPAVESRWGVIGPYERLAMLLTEIERTGDSPVEVGRRAGVGHLLGNAAVEDPSSTFVQEMARLGFDPSVRRKGDAIDVTLETCPFTSAAVADPDTVCGLHLGLVEGLATTIGGLVIDELIPKDPRRAHCRVRCRETSDDS